LRFFFGLANTAFVSATKAQVQHRRAAAYF
jgi:hypothetical protein